jgi:hypothetical protein
LRKSSDYDKKSSDYGKKNSDYAIRPRSNASRCIFTGGAGRFLKFPCGHMDIPL